MDVSSFFSMVVEDLFSAIEVARDEEALLGAGSPPEGFFVNSVAFAGNSLMIDELSEEARLKRDDVSKNAGNTPIVGGRRPQSSGD